MRKNYSKGELAKDILKGLALGGFIVACFACPNFAQVAKMFKANDWDERRRLKQSLRGLEKKKLIKFDEKNDKMIIEITEDGKKKVLKYKYEEMEIKKPKKWDKLWRMVIFDIPEVHKKARNALNLKLQELGFYPLQKSVFLHPFDCRNEIDFIGEYFNVREHINYFVVNEIEREDYFKYWFFR